MLIPRVKICGIREQEHLRVAAHAGADAIGLVFAERSPRAVSLEQARMLAAAVPPLMGVVGVFADDPIERIHELAGQLPFSAVQLHGEYDAAAIHSLRPHHVLRAVSFDPDTATESLRLWDGIYRESENLTGILIDTPDARRRGGTGRVFDWAALRRSLDEARPSVPIILAGGLEAANVAEAVRMIGPWAVDVSSGVESTRGVKDIHKIRAFCDAARSLNARSTV